MTYVRLRFELHVRDVEKTIEFYSKVLGLAPPPGSDLSGYIPLQAGAVTIGLGKFDELCTAHPFRRAGPDAPRGIAVEIVLEVEDVDALYEVARQQAEALGALIEPLQDREWGLRDFRVVDPDGNYLRITSR